ncbi:MAG: aldo/keto reductase [Clostridia bacterium]|nr:aldo/keto reductase [Clostridia bacterium]
MSRKINGKEIPQIAVGTWAWGAGQNGSKIVFGANADPKNLKESFDIAMKSGFNLFDTAAVYGMGNAEKLLAEFSKGKDIVLSDKYTPLGGFSEKKIMEMYEGSKEKFSDRLPDIYWLHQPKFIEENIKVLCKMKKEGKIGSIGVSNFNLEQLKLAEKVAKENGCRIAGVQNHFSLLFRNSDKNGVIDWCKKNSAVFFAYMVLEQGALTGKYTSKNPMPFFSRRGMAFNKSRLKKIEPLLENLEEIGKRHGLSTSETASAYVIKKGTVPIIGVTKPYQAESLAKIAAARLSEQEIEELEKTAEMTGVTVKAGWE